MAAALAFGMSNAMAFMVTSVMAARVASLVSFAKLILQCFHENT